MHLDPRVIVGSCGMKLFAQIHDHRIDIHRVDMFDVVEQCHCHITS